jgi:hypothetical protein
MSIVAQRIGIARVQSLPPQGVEQSSLAIVRLLTQLRWVFRLDGRWALERAR